MTLGRALLVSTKDVDPRECEQACFRGPFHSVLGDRIACRGTFREFIVFDDAVVYPAFILKYRRGIAADRAVIAADTAPEVIKGTVV